MTRRALACTVLAATALAAAAVAGPAAAALPSIDYTLTGTAGDADWFRGPVTVKWTVTGETSSSGCDTQTITGDTPGTQRSCSASNGDGPVTATTRFIRIDQSVPTTLSAVAARPADHGSWYTAPVALNWSGSDATSGIASCTTRTYSGPDDASASPSGSCRDKAGNVSATVALGISYDATAPAGVAGTRARAPDAAPWYRSPVRIDWGGTDAVSGVASCTTLTYSGPDNATATPTGTCTDKAGNVSGAVAVTVSYDATAPTSVAGARARAPDAAPWYHAPVRIDWNGADAVSGIDTCTTSTYSGPDDASAAPAGTCRDKAGNVSAAVPVSVAYDATAPTGVAGARARAPDFGTWYTAPVRVDWSGDDATSGIASCTTSTYSGPDDASAAPAGTCRDKAGNVSGAVAVGLAYDASAPTSVAGVRARAPDAGTWYRAPVRIDWNGADPVSGIASCTSSTYSGPDDAAGAATGTCTDRAGNRSAGVAVSVPYDATAPTGVSGARARAPNAAGWYTAPVGLDWTGTDATSGIASCTTRTYSGPDDATAAPSGTCTDKAGNASAAVPVAFAYDATAPTNVAGSPARAPDAGTWYRAPVRVDWTGADPVSGVASCTTRSYGGPDVTAVTLTGTCTDKAGNVSGARGFDLAYDATAPTGVSGAPARAPNAAGWYTAPVGLDWSGSDATSGIASCTTSTYSAPDSATAAPTGRCTDNAGNASAAVPVAFAYDATAPTNVTGLPARPPDSAPWYSAPVDLTWTGSDAVSGLRSCSTRRYDGPDAADAAPTGTCTDKAGNESASVPVGIHYDATPPDGVQARPARSPDAGTWYTAPVVVDWTGTDAMSGIAACTSLPYNGPDEPMAALTGTCRDKAGNVSAPRAFKLDYDATAPALTAVAQPATPGDALVRWTTGADAAHVTVVRAPGDGDAPDRTVFDGDGASSQIVDRGLVGGRAYTWTVSARDVAGNTAVARAVATPEAPPGATGTGPGPAAQTFAAPAATTEALADAAAPGATAAAGGDGAPVAKATPPRPAALPVLRWRARRDARYYNFQMSRAGRKVLSAWPTEPRFAVAATWTYAGRRQRLVPGTYTWYAWPGYGPRARHRYGRLLAQGTFTVR